MEKLLRSCSPALLRSMSDAQTVSLRPIGESNRSVQMPVVTAIDKNTQRMSGTVAGETTRNNCVHGVWRVLYIAIATIFSIIGIVGIVLPGLPTTPFLLLASYFLSRSSPRLNRILLANRIAGPILIQWQENRAVQPRVKLQAILLVNVSIALLVYFSNLPLTLLLIVLSLAAIGVFVILRLPTAKRKLA